MGQAQAEAGSCAVPQDLLDVVRLRESGHVVRVAVLARRSAPLVGLRPDFAYAAGLLHDVGKLILPAEVLGAPRPLTEGERRWMRRHPEEGALVIARLWPECPEEIVHAVRHHHEREDGSGYPDGLRSLPGLTALIAACDVWDAVAYDRPYRAALPAPDVAAHVLGLALPSTTLLAVVRAADEAREEASPGVGRVL